MNRLLTACFVLACLLVSAGCGGDYILTAPDVLAQAGGEGVSVVRLRRTDFLLIPTPVKGAAMRIQIGGEVERGAYTDELGYAGTTVPAPAKPGLYDLKISHLDVWGDEVVKVARAYVWDPNAPAVAVDFDSLPRVGTSLGKEAAAALQRLARDASIVYLTRSGTASHVHIPSILAMAEYPDGPVMEWQRQYWHIVRDGKYYNMPRLVVENRLVSQLPDLRSMIRGLTVAICDSELAAKAFGDSGMRVVVIGKPSIGGAGVVHRASWAELAEKGL